MLNGVTNAGDAMTTTVQHMDTEAETGASADTPGGPPQPTAPAELDAALLRLAAAVPAGAQQPARPAWQTSLLIALTAALIAAATAGYVALRADIATLGTNLRTEIAAVEQKIADSENSLRTEIAAVENSLGAEIAAVEQKVADVENSLRTEMQTGFREVNATLLDHPTRPPGREPATN